MRAGRAARQADDRAAGVHVPVGRTEADECRDEVDAAGILNRLGQRLALGGAPDQPEPVAQPLDRRARDEHAALERAYVVAPPIRHAIVVRSPCDEATGSGPVFRSMKHPVP